jgi:hypothetical protein
MPAPIDLRNPIAKIVFTLFIISFGIAALGALTTGLSGSNSAGHDFISYWATGQQITHQKNPYDVAAILALERSAGFPANAQPLMMRNPPSSLFLVVPLGFVGARAGSILWFASILGSLVLCLHLLWILNGRPASRLNLLGYAFPPSLFCIAAGQTAIFALLGFILFLYCHRSRPIAAGAALTLCALKPHLFVAFAAALILWIILNRKYAIIAGLILTAAVEWTMALLFDPSVLSHYLGMTRSTSVNSEFTPVASSLLRKAIDPSAIWLQYLPIAVAAVWAIWYYSRHKEEWDWQSQGLTVLLVSVAAAPYGWISDQVLAWPAIAKTIETADRRVFLILLSLITALLVTLFSPIPMHSLFFAWTGTAWLLWNVYATKVKEASPPPLAGEEIVITNT